MIYVRCMFHSELALSQRDSCFHNCYIDCNFTHAGFQKKASDVEAVYEDVDKDEHKESTPPTGAMESSATLSEL